MLWTLKVIQSKKWKSSYFFSVWSFFPNIPSPCPIKLSLTIFLKWPFLSFSFLHNCLLSPLPSFPSPLTPSLTNTVSHVSKNRNNATLDLQNACSHSVVSDPATVAHQAPLSMGFPRQECWSGLPCPPPGDLPDPGIKPESSALQADSLPSEPRYTGSAQLTCLGWMNEVLSQLQGTSIPLVCPILCPLYLVTASPSLRELHPSTPIPLSFPLFLLCG